MSEKKVAVDVLRLSTLQMICWRGFDFHLSLRGFRVVGEDGMALRCPFSRAGEPQGCSHWRSFPELRYVRWACKLLESDQIKWSL